MMISKKACCERPNEQVYASTRLNGARAGNDDGIHRVIYGKGGRRDKTIFYMRCSCFGMRWDDKSS